MQPLIPLAPATVVEHRAVEQDDRLRGGDHELSIQEVVAVRAPESEVSAVAGLVLGLMLTNLEVGGACGNLHHVSVALTVDETGSRNELMNYRFFSRLQVSKFLTDWLDLLLELRCNLYTLKYVISYVLQC